jgi:non-homologous end joining protein Ku
MRCIRYQRVCDQCGEVVEYRDFAKAPTHLDDTDDVSDPLAKLEASVRRRREQSAVPKAAPSTKVAAKKVAAKKPPVKK